MTQDKKETKKRKYASAASGCSNHQELSEALLSKPKRPLSAYNIFFSKKRADFISAARDKEREEARARDPSTSRKGGVFKALSRRIGQEWRDLPYNERATYEAQATESKRRYDRDLINWRMKQMEQMSRTALNVPSADIALKSISVLGNHQKAEAGNDDLLQEEGRGLSASTPLLQLSILQAAQDETKYAFTEGPMTSSVSNIFLQEGGLSSTSTTPLLHPQASQDLIKCFVERPLKIMKSSLGGSATSEPNKRLSSAFFHVTEKLSTVQQAPAIPDNFAAFDGDFAPQAASLCSVSPPFQGKHDFDDVPMPPPNLPVAAFDFRKGSGEENDRIVLACSSPALGPNDKKGRPSLTFFDVTEKLNALKVPTTNNIKSFDSDDGDCRPREALSTMLSASEITCGKQYDGNGDEDSFCWTPDLEVECASTNNLYDPTPLMSASEKTSAAFSCHRGTTDVSFWTDPEIRSLMESLNGCIEKV